MVRVNLNNVADGSDDELQRLIPGRSSKLFVTMTIGGGLVASDSELAENWLLGWYIAETLAAHVEVNAYEFEEGYDGSIRFGFDFTVSNPNELTRAMAHFARGLDPGDSEGKMLLANEARQWLETRSDAPSPVPDIEACYRESLEDECGEEVELDYPDEEEYADEFN
jgi:hypothetical protein